MAHRIEGQIGLVLAVRRCRRHLVDRINLQRFRPSRIRNHTILALRLGEADRLGPLPEEIDHRRAVERESVAVDDALELGRAAVEV
jgi:hypothetical protein